MTVYEYMLQGKVYVHSCIYKSQSSRKDLLEQIKKTILVKRTTVYMVNTKKADYLGMASAEASLSLLFPSPQSL
jgi:hypothetical protein